MKQGEDPLARKAGIIGSFRAPCMMCAEKELKRFGEVQNS